MKEDLKTNFFKENLKILVTWCTTICELVMKPRCKMLVLSHDISHLQYCVTVK